METMMPTFEERLQEWTEDVVFRSEGSDVNAPVNWSVDRLASKATKELDAGIVVTNAILRAAIGTIRQAKNFDLGKYPFGPGE